MQKKKNCPVFTLTELNSIMKDPQTNLNAEQIVSKDKFQY
jgi:hypothetical protein